MFLQGLMVEVDLAPNSLKGLGWTDEHGMALSSHLTNRWVAHGRQPDLGMRLLIRPAPVIRATRFSNIIQFPSSLGKTFQFLSAMLWTLSYQQYWLWRGFLPTVVNKQTSGSGRWPASPLVPGASQQTMAKGP